MNVNGIERKPGWEDILAGRISGASKLSYEIGVHDCVIFAAETLAEISPNDFTSVFKNKYKTRKGSLRVIGKYGKTLLEAVSNVINREPLNPRFFSRGCPVIIKDNDGLEHVGICLGEQSAFLGEDGLSYVKTLDCIAVWRI